MQLSWIRDLNETAMKESRRISVVFFIGFSLKIDGDRAYVAAGRKWSEVV